MRRAWTYSSPPLLSFPERCRMIEHVFEWICLGLITLGVIKVSGVDRKG